MSRRLRSERARTALHLLILANVLVYAYRDDLRPRLGLSRTYRVEGGTLRSMLLSIFYHAEPTHLLANMIALHRHGTELFANASSRRWRSPFLVALSYAACGVGAFGGIEALSRYHEYQWERKVRDARAASRCTHWLCRSLNEAFGEDVSSLFTDALADVTTSLSSVDLRLSMRYFREIYRIGASGVVYGWMGMRLVASWMSPYHSRLDGTDLFFMVATLAHDLGNSPISLEDLRMEFLLGGDGVDHAAHIMGAACGMIWASMLILWERMSSFGIFGGRRWRWWGGSRNGRRLGASWEDEQRINEQREQQRRQNSRLLNQGSTSTGRRSRDRVML